MGCGHSLFHRLCRESIPHYWAFHHQYLAFTNLPPLAGLGNAPSVACASAHPLETLAHGADDGYLSPGGVCRRRIRVQRDWSVGEQRNNAGADNDRDRPGLRRGRLSGVVLTPSLIYIFSLLYVNYTTATPAFAGAGCTIQLLWRRSGGPLELVPSEAIHARGRRDYYSFGGAVVAMKEGVMNSVARTLSYLHGDHLGSVSPTTNASGQKVSEQRYKPGACPERQRGGEVRWNSGAGMPTDFAFTSQRAGAIPPGSVWVIRRGQSVTRGFNT